MPHERPFGVPVAPGIFAVGGGDWVMTWSPWQIHPYALQWLIWSAQSGPSPARLPDPEVWAYTLFTDDIS